MNRIFKLKFNRYTNQQVVVSEITKGNSRQATGSKIKVLALSLLALLTLSATNALAAPQGGVVQTGTATITTPDSANTVINSTTDTIINWNSFSIAANETVTFNQANITNTVLNRVTGLTQSEINGIINSNGNVFVINPNGIIFGANSVVNANSFIASTLDVRNEDFATKNYVFNGVADSTASIINNGNISVTERGNIMFFAHNIENHGELKVEDGKIFLWAGQSITVADKRRPHVTYVLHDDSKVSNTGKIIANNGQVQLYGYKVENTGTIYAPSGNVKIGSQKEASIAGTINVSNYTGVAGNIYISSDENIDIKPTAKILAKGINGGNITLNGYNTGQDANSRINIQANAFLDVSAVESAAKLVGIRGNAGRITVNAIHVKVEGHLKAKGGENGNAGTVSTKTIRFTPDGGINNNSINRRTQTLLPDNLQVANATVDVSGFTETANGVWLLTTETATKEAYPNLIITPRGKIDIEARDESKREVEKELAENPPLVRKEETTSENTGPTEEGAVQVNAENNSNQSGTITQPTATTDNPTTTTEKSTETTEEQNNNEAKTEETANNNANSNKDTRDEYTNETDPTVKANAEQKSEIENIKANYIALAIEKAKLEVELNKAEHKAEQARRPDEVITPLEVNIEEVERNVIKAENAEFDIAYHVNGNVFTAEQFINLYKDLTIDRTRAIELLKTKIENEKTAYEAIIAAQNNAATTQTPDTTVPEKTAVEKPSVVEPVTTPPEGTVQVNPDQKTPVVDQNTTTTPSTDPTAVTTDENTGSIQVIPHDETTNKTPAAPNTEDDYVHPAIKLEKAKAEYLALAVEKAKLQQDLNQEILRLEQLRNPDQKYYPDTTTLEQLTVRVTTQKNQEMADFENSHMSSLTPQLFIQHYNASKEDLKADILALKAQIAAQEKNYLERDLREAEAERLYQAARAAEQARYTISINEQNDLLVAAEEARLQAERAVFEAEQARYVEAAKVADKQIAVKEKQVAVEQARYESYAQQIAAEEARIQAENLKRQETLEIQNQVQVAKAKAQELQSQADEAQRQAEQAKQDAIEAAKAKAEQVRFQTEAAKRQAEQAKQEAIEAAKAKAQEAKIQAQEAKAKAEQAKQEAIEATKSKAENDRIQEEAKAKAEQAKQDAIEAAKAKAQEAEQVLEEVENVVEDSSNLSLADRAVLVSKILTANKVKIANLQKQVDIYLEINDEEALAFAKAYAEEIKELEKNNSYIEAWLKGNKKAIPAKNTYLSKLLK